MLQPLDVAAADEGFEPTAARPAGINTAGCTNSPQPTAGVPLLCRHADAQQRATAPVQLPQPHRPITTQAHPIPKPLPAAAGPICWTPHHRQLDQLQSDVLLKTDCLSWAAESQQFPSACPQLQECTGCCWRAVSTPLYIMQVTHS